MPQEGYLQKVKALCVKYNVLLIADEVQTGFGRTGYMFGHEHDMPNDKPDILVFAKSASGGFYPVSGILASKEIMSQVKAGEHGSTFGGNPLGMAIAKKAIEVLTEEGMVENSRNMGKYLLDSVKSNIKSELVADVRGRGLFAGIEIRHDAKVDGGDFAKILFGNGLLTKSTHDYVVRLSPALVIEKNEVDHAVEILDKSMKQLEQLQASRS